MKDIKIKNILSLVAFLAMFSCADDFIIVAPDDENSEDFFNTEEDYQKALVSAYDMLQATARNYQLGEIASDNTLCGGQNALDTPGYQEIDDMIHTPVNAQLREIWTWMYTGVNRTNYIMEFQDKLDFPSKTSVLAQTRFLRAYYYFQLVKWFGDVPLAVDARIQFGDQFNIERTPKAEVYTQIEQDLMFAASNLPYTQPQTGRITKGAAEALLGKVYLYQDKFTESATVLESLINNGPHRLLSSTEAPLMWENENENNIESVFEIQYSDIDGGSYDCFYCLEGNFAIGFNGVRGYVGPVFDFGFSFNVPVQEVVDAFEPGDIRLEYSILDIEQWIADNPTATYDETAGFEQTGYFNRKYIARQGDLNLPDAALTNPNNTRAIRYADVLLMAAEALNRGGISDTRAQDYLNEVRNRAMLDDVTTTGPNLTNDIYKERRVELVGEGHRFFDLVRTGRAATEIDGFQTGKHELFPIPIQEIQLAGNVWEQNPGY
ncbi:RagB/SusD family nutrient uptake outer membrane protein [Algibacter aquimarinus]|uniref:RagB/SusD family nutrient uptake outer membrane protein n=1 Tax=Algibacter aquimarinus TaxID=1136748 RepID=A0ABP9HDQ5_9FLAO